MSVDSEEQEDELLALQSIFSSDEFVRKESKVAGEIRVCVELPADFTVAMKEVELLSQYEISYLPPLSLIFELPEDYPSCSPPSFTLVCSWLTHTQLSALGAHLLELYQATGGAVVLFTWVQFLKEDALRFLDIHTLLELPSNEHSQDSLHAALPGPNNNHHAAASGPIDNQSGDVSDPCALALSVPSSEAEHPRKTPQNEDQPVSGLSITPSQTLLSQILIYDVAQQQKQFGATVFECGVCFMGCFGSDCAQLAECGHIFCRACLAEFCKVQITEGNVQGVTCPQADCTATPTPAQVRSLVGEDLFSRYDRLLLQNALDCMPDVVYCPRLTCGLAVIHEKSSKAAVCSVCSFAFCVTCRNTYHAAEDCQGTMDIKQREKATQGSANLPLSKEGIEALWDDYASGSKQRKHLLETRYGRVFHFTVVEYLSQNWVAVNSKNCPHCFWRIQKISGCNVMTCSKCKLLFCWACLTKLPDNISKHFMGNPCSQY